MSTYVNIKAGLITIFGYVFYLRMSNMRTALYKKITFGMVYSAAIVIIIRIITGYVKEPYKSLMTILLSSIFLKVGSKRKYNNMLIDMTTALAVSYILYILSSVMGVAVFFYIFEIHIIDFRLALLTCIAEIFLCIIIMRKKADIIVSEEKNIGGIGLLLSGMVMILYSLFREKRSTDGDLWLIVSGTILCAFGMLYWIKKENIIAFNSKAGTAEKMKLKDRLDEMEEENRFLDGTLRYIESRLHNENKRLPAYQQAVEALIYGSTDEASRAKAVKILSELKEARNELSLMQTDEMNRRNILPLTGMVLLDAIFASMSDKATRLCIDYKLIVDDNVLGITRLITQARLETLVADLIVNAITAVMHSDKDIKSILVRFGIRQGAYEFIVEDSGIPFRADTFMYLGKQRITTHKETGGSGIGFMTVFDILNSCGASLSIIEMPPGSSKHSKMIIVRFDSKDRRTIKTYRISELSVFNDGRWLIEDFARDLQI